MSEPKAISLIEIGNAISEKELNWGEGGHVYETGWNACLNLLGV